MSGRSVDDNFTTSDNLRQLLADQDFTEAELEDLSRQLDSFEPRPMEAPQSIFSPASASKSALQHDLSASGTTRRLRAHNEVIDVCTSNTISNEQKRSALLSSHLKHGQPKKSKALTLPEAGKRQSHGENAHLLHEGQGSSAWAPNQTEVKTWSKATERLRWVSEGTHGDGYFVDYAPEANQNPRDHHIVVGADKSTTPSFMTCDFDDKDQSNQPSSRGDHLLVSEEENDESDEDDEDDLIPDSIPTSSLLDSDVGGNLSPYERAEIELAMARSLS